MAPKIIFAHSRNGSSRFHEPIASHNWLYYGIGGIPGSEFLKDESWFVDFKLSAKDKKYENFMYCLVQQKLNNIHDRIEFLEQCRAKGVDFSYKIKPMQMYRNNLIEWMLEFYADWEIIRVCRKDNFRAGLSFMYQRYTNFNKSQFVKGEETYTVLTEPFVINNKEDLITYWKRNKRIENETWGTKIYNEDWTDEQICDWLNLESRYIRHKKIPVDYEKLIINIDEVREWYDQFLQS